MKSEKPTSEVKVIKLWEFPPLSEGKQGRIFTKHFTNLSLNLLPNHFSLLSWLVYQSAADNTVKYSTGLLKMYQQSVVFATNRYKSVNPYLTPSVPNARKYFQYLIERSFLLPTDSAGEYLINPNLTYSKLYVKSGFYKEWVNSYNNTASASLSIEDKRKNISAINRAYLNHTAANFQSRREKKK